MRIALSIQQVAQQSGVPSKTLRYWESVGVLPKASRNQHGYRIYGSDILRRVQFVQKTKRLGFSLSEIRSLITTAKTKGTACSEVVKRIDEKLEMLNRRIESLLRLRSELKNYSRQWKKQPCPPLSPLEICCLIESLPNEEKIGGEQDHELSHQTLAGIRTPRLR